MLGTGDGIGVRPGHGVRPGVGAPHGHGVRPGVGVPHGAGVLGVVEDRVLRWRIFVLTAIVRSDLVQVGQAIPVPAALLHTEVPAVQ